ncbi:succinate-semialdehyde dehydrogenase (NADP(+)) [Haloferax mediterranei ATCC 33500]|uniref:Aldehyde dehydrogenase n=1 Tax=Haloferax mediterranei (strain ATCC 33500 / DSM 1411 / JCM 8866 / NBRC 14739 / NCIMB 2177 / R-4) TaxID=523841 RepID=I3R7V3_HALMT|nr:succinic semialdehyde dehydrogenase [Haloferax mediterranei]AFK20313.1 aldehyde dehydrogenase [Haloferax mediterranei ATCC 33500]AHZ23682.1 succinate-semialdehyde dehydrogenase [Haloferax mediterranei ATCC 33500]ELZ99169.1 succinic semialdehyde dehydrogenase [Haloferax mediterranei ATCC 33500]MDX5986932.1 succinic semialdehyde dehydrogenase [Haloferax mediterranei ATCC 33500]QCQ76252.1 succinate-semialdehyde dehydrogenase (NADP(+)) [Haloferax mediterranei ATCC 33500]
MTDSPVPPVTSAQLESLAHLVSPDGSREQLLVRAPYDDSVVGEVPLCTPEDVQSTVDEARTARSEWSTWPVEDRAAVFRRFHDALLDRRESLLDVIQTETGKARPDALEEVLDAATTARYYANLAERALTPTRRSGAVPFVTKTVEHHHPVGVVGVISPWNYPLSLSVSESIPALLAGNAVVLKPDEGTPFTALWALDLLRECGLPDTVLQVVTGEGPTLGDSLIEGVDYVSFTGSTEVGRIVAETAGRHLTDCSLELGGKNPLLVLDDADVDAAARGAARGCFANAGQLCISIERIYVHESVADDFRDAFIRETQALTLDAGYDYDHDVGSLLDQELLEKVEAHVSDAVEKGATVLTGGRARPELGPYFYEPTVLTDVTPEMTLADEETFGPVVSLYEVESVSEAIERANDSAYGLNASVWTQNTERGEQVATRLDAGTVNVNEAYVAAWASIDAPMGGMKDSGLGRRHGRHGLVKYTEPQTVATQRFGLLSPPKRGKRLWADGATLGLRLWKRLTELGP